MQFNRKADGSLEKLSMNVIDTGMGFERLVRALQGKHSNYDTDIFQPIIHEIERLSGLKYGDKEETDVAMRVIADHIRAVSFSIADGQLPSNAKAGYVIRRILRRAVRYAYTFLGQKEAFLYKLLPVLTKEMGESYPELVAQQTLISKVMKEEEDSFLRTLSNGINLLTKAMEELKSAGKTELDGVQAFTLFDTYGFPLDLTELICRENGISVNEKQFNEEMQKQKERARNAAAMETGDWIILREGEPQFVGYDFTEHECHILRYRKVTQKKNIFYQLVFDYTPFYGEMGGQVGESGVIVSEHETIEITDTKHENGINIHLTTKLPEHPEAEFMACVDIDKRNASAANHSATHLLDQALRQVLGEHVEQKGSFVSGNTLRFDFSHFQKVTDEELRQVERLVNAKIRADLPLQEHRETPIEEAKKMGAIALFGEKYGDKVRVIQFGDSVEFCGGIHAKSTGRIGFFKILSESSVAAGVRRIEAITGQNFEESLYVMEDTLNAIRGLFNNAKDLPGVLRKYIEEHDGMKKEIESFQAQAVESIKERLLGRVEDISGMKVIKAVLPLAPDAAKDLVFKLRAAIPNDLLAVVGTFHEDKPSLNVMISEDLVNDRQLNAGKLVREAAKLIQGGGGGQPHFATAGGKNKDGLSAAVEKVVELAKA